MAFFNIRTAVAAFAIMTASSALAENDGFSYVPHVHGTLRTRYELSTESGESRFQVRNARLAIDGRVAPAVDYFMQVDLCDQGTFKSLDFWARVELAKGLKVQAGQFRMPFGVDPFRAPHNYIFANRSFIGRQICNYRAVGFKLSYSLPALPLTVEGGVFNPYTIGNHNVWSKRMAYAAKATYTLGTARLSTGLMSISPDEVRANLVDGCVSWSPGRWLLEAEYMYEHYTHDSHKPCHGYNAFVDYHFPIHAGLFDRLSFQGRFDAMTSHSTGYRNDEGQLTDNNPARRRITLGSTISHVKAKNLYVDLRVNYEKYFYDKGVETPAGQGDKALVELVVRF